MRSDMSVSSRAERRKTVYERKELLSGAIAIMAAQGFRVESQSDFRAIVVKGKYVNHVLHLLLSIVTAGL